MSFNGAATLQARIIEALHDSKIYGLTNMAKWELIKRTANPIKAFWWNYWPGTQITVKWPVGWTEPQPAPGGGMVQWESADPNDHYRPWLEKNVGRQGWDWDWRHKVHDHMFQPDDYLIIKIRKGKSKWATHAALKWA